MQLGYSSIMAYHSIHLDPFHRHPHPLSPPSYPWHQQLLAIWRNLWSSSHSALQMGHSPWGWYCVATCTAHSSIFNGLGALHHSGPFRGCVLKLNDRELYDDILQDNEKDLICGVYGLETGTLYSPGIWKRVLIILWRLWWSNCLPVLVASSICIPAFGNVDWILDTLLWGVVSTSSEWDPWTLHWVKEFYTLGLCFHFVGMVMSLHGHLSIIWYCFNNNAMWCLYSHVIIIP